MHPVFAGSAMTGAGVGQLTAGITSLLPATDRKAEADGPVSASVFKVERGPAGEKVAYTRMFTGTLRPRDRVPVNAEGAGKITAISVFQHGGASDVPEVAAGQIAKVWGLPGIQIGDTLGRAAARQGAAPLRAAVA